MVLARRSSAMVLLVALALPAASIQSVHADQPGPHSASAYELAASSLIYVSDYFSFVGADRHGLVAFALDNNRGRDGEAYQAEHFVVLHDEKNGWIDIAGNGFYDNTKRELDRIPDSPFFQFQHSPEAGLTITSAKNQLTLNIKPISQRTLRTDGKSTIWMGSAPAVLTWQGRTIPGRVIYEYLVMPDFNRLTRTYWGMWKEFQGLYLLVGDSNDAYLHSQRSEKIAALVGKLAGFAVLNEQTDSLHDFRFEVLGHDMAFGFYRWPTSWHVTWQGGKGPASMTLMLSDRKAIGNWVIGGFSMGIVQGELSYDGHTWPIYGLAELIM